MKALGLKPKNMKKGLGVPNIYPYKEELMNTLERKEKLEEEQKQKMKEKMKEKKGGNMENYI